MILRAFVESAWQMLAVQLRRTARATDAVGIIFILDRVTAALTRLVNLSKLPGCVDELLPDRTGGGPDEDLMRGEAA